MKHFRQFIILFFILILFAPKNGLAKENILRVPFSEHPPGKTLGPEGTPGGIDTELMQMLAERLNLEIEFIACPFKRGLFMLESGEADMMSSVLRRPDREQYLHFITPPYKPYTHKAFYVLKGQGHSIQQHSDLRNLRIGTGLGASYYPAFDNDNTILKTPVSKGDTNLKMLLEHRVDAVIMTEAAGDYRIAKLGLSDRIAKADFMYREQQGVYMVLSKKSPLADRIDEMNQIMLELIANDARKQIKTRFYKELITP